MMGGLSLNASGAALGSLFGVFEAARGACCDAVDRWKRSRALAGVRTPERVIVWAWGRMAVALRLWRAIREQAFVCDAQLALALFGEQLFGRKVQVAAALLDH